MLYHWLYRRRFGQEAVSLDETARGQWPIYHAPTPLASTKAATSLAVAAVPAIAAAALRVTNAN
jgi:hypothetical protein